MLLLFWRRQFVPPVIPIIATMAGAQRPAPFDRRHNAQADRRPATVQDSIRPAQIITDKR